MRLVLRQARIRVINIHAKVLPRARILDRLNPAIQERLPRRVVVSIVCAVVELHLEDCITVRVCGGVGSYLGDSSILAAVEIEHEVPGTRVGASVGLPVI